MTKHKYDIQDENDSIKASILRIAGVLSKTPTQKEYKENVNKGELSLEQIIYRFGTWSDAIKYSGLKPNPFQQPPRAPEITRRELINKLNLQLC